MIELVSALMLFLLILGGLTLAVNKATALWSSSHSKQTEQETADLILNLIEDDLRHAVTDNAPDRNNNESPPTFFIDGEQLDHANEVKAVLQFIRHRSYISKRANKSSPALDAVFYTYYGNSLFRHVIPLEYSDINNPEHIGELLKQLQPSIENPALHKQIITYLNNPAESAPPTQNAFSLLAHNIQQPGVIAAIPYAYANAPANQLYNQSFILNNSIQTLPEYSKLETKVLPDYVLIAVRVFNEADWKTYRDLLDSGDQIAFDRKEPHLGRTVSRRISFQTSRGARLK